MTPRTRTTVAVLCIALVVIAGIVPALATALGSVILVALWLVLPPILVSVTRRAASHRNDQPVCLLALLDSRGPPSVAALA